MNFALGGNFNSRINLNLREDKGYTYGAHSRFYGDLLSGQFSAGASVRADATDKSLIEFTNEIQRFAQSGLREDELAFMRAAINQQDALRYETPNAKLGFLAQIIEHGLNPNFTQERAAIVQSIKLEELNALAQKHLQLDDMVIVVVGDAKTLKPQLEALGYQVENFTP